MDQRIAVVLGLGVSGISTIKFLKKLGYVILATDDKLDLAVEKLEVKALAHEDLHFISPQEAIKKIESYPQSFSFVISSPGVKPSHPLLLACKKVGLSYFGDIELAFRTLVKHNIPILGITGTNGKTTVTSLVQHMLVQAGHHAKACGNIGDPLLDEIDSAASQKNPLVLELSSFQLETARAKALTSAIVLNITADHLDHHKSMCEYAEMKLQIGRCLRPGSCLYLHEKVFLEYPFEEKGISVFSYGFNKERDIYSDGKSVIRFQEKEIDLPDILQRIFSHDVENFLAAYAQARDFGVSPEACVQAFLTFKKPPHRIQFVREVEGIKFYDDSKGTNIDAVIRAVEAIPEKIILIAGGVHKGASYLAWREVFQNKVKAIFAIGEAAPIIQKDLSQDFPVTPCKTLEDAIISSKAFAKRGETVLLSPGCSSFDMFKNYKERGEKFQALVWGLVEEIR